MTIRQASHFHERVPVAQGGSPAVARVFVVDVGASVYQVATLRSDGIAEAFIVYDAGTGTYRLNDNGSGASALAYFAGSNRVAL